jgi:BlaI family penicillinase repressor
MNSEMEFQLLKVLWSLKHATTAQVRERYNVLNGTSVAYTTVMTMLGRLVSKGSVKVDKAREPFLYSAAAKRERVLRDRVKAFVKSAFDGQTDALVLHLVESDALSVDDVQRIKAAIARKKKEGAA